MAEKKKVSSSVVAKAGIWYTISNFAFRSVAFITTPIFARILTNAQYGEFNNITSWVSILFIFTSCDLYTSIIRAKLDYEDDLERYGFSVLTLGSIITIALFLFTIPFSGFFADLMDIQPKYFIIIFIYLLFVQGFYVYITIERAHYKYKTFSILTGIGIVASCLLSLLLVTLMNNKLDARVIGQYVPYILIGMVLYVLVALKGKKVYFPYYKYALSLSLPLIPHLLSMTLLSSSDRIMITKLSGAEYTAIYSIAYIVANIITILIDSMNKAWAPWLLDSLKANEKSSIKKTAFLYFTIFIVMIFGILLVAPEIVLILGGKKYMDGIYVLPPLVIGTVFQFAYTMYVQVEYFEKKMKMVAIATSVAAIINVALNFVLIPKFGYIAAGYTTLISYMVLFLLHYFTVANLGYRNIFSRRVIFGGLILSLLTLPVSLILYKFQILRYITIGLYLLVLGVIVYRRRDIIIRFIRKRQV